MILGTREWQAFENAFSAVFPEREIVRLPADITDCP